LVKVKDTISSLANITEINSENQFGNIQSPLSLAPKYPEVSKLAKYDLKNLLIANETKLPLNVSLKKNISLK